MAPSGGGTARARFHGEVDRRRRDAERAGRTPTNHGAGATDPRTPRAVDPSHPGQQARLAPSGLPVSGGLTEQRPPSAVSDRVTGGGREDSVRRPLERHDSDMDVDSAGATVATEHVRGVLHMCQAGSYLCVLSAVGVRGSCGPLMRALGQRQRGRVGHLDVTEIKPSFHLRKHVHKLKSLGWLALSPEEGWQAEAVEDLAGLLREGEAAGLAEGVDEARVLVIPQGQLAKSIIGEQEAQGLLFVALLV